MDYRKNWILLKEYLSEQQDHTAKELESARASNERTIQNILQGRIDALVDIQARMKEIER